MFIYARLAHALARVIFTRARVSSLGRAAWRWFSAGFARSAAIVTTAVAALTALVCTTGCPAPPANGSISVAWEIRDAKDIAVSCDGAGARFVALRLRNRATSTVIATAFPCPNSPGTAQIAPGLYDVSFQLDAADGTRLATAADQTGVSIVSGRLTQLAPITLRLAAAPQSTLVLSLATGATTNCRPSSAGGAGITGDTITLERAGDGCAAVTFTRQRGTEQRGTYTVNCSSPQIAPCIEKDETLTTQLEPGGYVVRARGKIGALNCFARDDTLQVPSTGIVTRTLGLLRTNATGCPP